MVNSPSLDKCISVNGIVAILVLVVSLLFYLNSIVVPNIKIASDIPKCMFYLCPLCCDHLMATNRNDLNYTEH